MLHTAAALCSAAGTQVLDLEAEKVLSDGKSTIKGFATIDNVCLINIEGTGMVGVPGADGTAALSSAAVRTEYQAALWRRCQTALPVALP